MISNRLGAVQIRIGVEVDPDLVSIQPIVNLDRQILDRTEREIEVDAAIPRKINIIVKSHDVDARPVHRSPIDDTLKIPPKISSSKLLVLQYSANFLRDLAYELGHGHRGPSRNPQRQHVRNHSRYLSRLGIARAHRNA